MIEWMTRAGRQMRSVTLRLGWSLTLGGWGVPRLTGYSVFIFNRKMSLVSRIPKPDLGKEKKEKEKKKKKRKRKKMKKRKEKKKKTTCPSVADTWCRWSPVVV